MLRLVTLLVVVMGSMLAGCKSSGSAAGGSAMTSIKDLTGDWTLAKLQGVDLATLLPTSMHKPNLSFGPDGKVSGFTGVNRLSSALDLEALAKGQFKLGPAITTRMAGPPEAMSVENKFTTALQQATGAKVSEGTLTLTDGAKELLSFVRGK